LLRDGCTDLLPRFISKKGRPFKAYLVKGAGGKITFEFEAREPTKGRSKAADSDVKAPPIPKATKEAAISKPRRKAA